ncbi:alpha/beta fold hydrolase [Streptomyces durmitorensis]|uniref:Alpha/beta hydrolase n=1 Tax=Streptomyces durmitorensis TaxID=319947 RepID=A0ABY4PP60_9ACTN|nr:alpha/beta hydrolase [Streptomyces durmitorensis]UQT54910.1 alpha/beta hydrolase [Streptomyces durmitorensis]
MSAVAVHEATLRAGLVLPYAEVGDPAGTPVVLVHGYVDSWWAFEPLLRRMPSSLHGYAPTQRGHGDADKPTDGYLPEDFAADLVAFMDTVGIERAVLVGASSGGVQARIVAGRDPDRVAGLVLLGVPVTLADKPGAAELWDVVRELEGPVDRDLVERFALGMTAEPLARGFLETVVEENLKAPARVWREALRGLLETDLRATLSGILVPTLAVWGDRDPILTREEQQTILDTVIGSRLIVYEGAGHVVHWDRPERVVRDIAAFAASVDGNGNGNGNGVG